ncbi:3D domain-containing protein [Candidatus Azambacteria bacterium]|nr:3D domain-containing protein [Candidatus Azambacteria bacterium]MBI3685004.1 3D domain-containing protein [Candidatus Azambacteria bacterium]
MGITSVFTILGVLMPFFAALPVEGAPAGDYATTTGIYAPHQGSTDAVLYSGEPVQDDIRPKFAVAFEVTTTAYSSTPDQTDDSPFTMANGKRVHDGAVAANFLPFGTTVRFPDLFGNKMFIVEDRMHRRFGDRVDVWMEKRADARAFGIQRARMEIVARAD